MKTYQVDVQVQILAESEEAAEKDLKKQLINCLTVEFLDVDEVDSEEDSDEFDEEETDEEEAKS